MSRVACPMGSIPTISIGRWRRCTIPRSGSTAGSLRTAPKRDHRSVPLLPGELLPPGALDDAEPDDQRVNVTGNEGVKLSHSYRRAALVLWPERHTVRTLAHGGIGGAVAYVADELARTDDATGRGRALVAQLIDVWPAALRSHPYRRYETAGAAASCTDALRLLRGLGDEATTRRFLHEITIAHYSGEENAELLETATTLSPVALHGWLPEFVAAALPRHPEALLDLLRRLCEHEMSRPDRFPGLLRRPGGNHAAAPLTEGTAPPPPRGHRWPRSRHAPRDRTRRQTLHAGLHEEARRRLRATVRAVRRRHRPHAAAGRDFARR